MIEPFKSKAITGAKKAQGQLKKVLEMLEQDKYCIEIFQQIKAVEGLLNSLSSNVMESHLTTCAGRAFSSKDDTERAKVIEEIMTAFKRSKK